MNCIPRPVEVDADDAHAVAEKGHPDRSPVIDRGVEEDALHVLPAQVSGLVLEVGVELVEVGGVEAVTVVPGDEGVLVELAVEDDLPLRPLDGDVNMRGSTCPASSSHWPCQSMGMARTSAPVQCRRAKFRTKSSKSRCMIVSSRRMSRNRRLPCCSSGRKLWWTSRQMLKSRP